MRYFKYFCPSREDVWTLLLLLLAGMLFGVGVSYIMGQFCSEEFVNNYSIIITYPLQFLPAIAFAAKQGSRDENDGSQPYPLDSGHYSTREGFFTAIQVIIVTIAAAVVIDPSTMLLPDMPDFIKAAMEMLSEGPLWVALITTAVFAPICEEWLCRGMILRGLLHRTSPEKAILLSSLAFAVIHLNPWQAIPAFAMGCLFGLVYYKTGSLKLTMLMHAANNAMSVLLGQCPATKDCDYIYQIFNDKSSYILFFSVCLCIVAAYITQLLRKSHNFKSSN